MEQLEEQEMQIQYSEMSAFDFNSEEFQRIRKECVECKNFVFDFVWKVKLFLNKFRPVAN